MSAQFAFEPLGRRAERLAAGENAYVLQALNAWNADNHARTGAFAEHRPVTEAAVRVGVKDVLDVSGWRTGFGAGPRGRRPRTSTVPVLRHFPLRTVMAKTTTTEYGIGLEHGCVNIAYPHLDPGGSSTGSAVAVAAGLCDIALGTDSVASVRLPAAATGVYGLRTSDPVNDLHPGHTISDRLDAPGWFARSAGDLVLAWNRWIAPGRPVPATVMDLSVEVVGVGEALERVLDEPMRDAAHAARDALMKAGIHYREEFFGDLFLGRAISYEMCTIDAAAGLTGAEDLSSSTRIALSRAQDLDPVRVRARLEALRAAARERLGPRTLWLLPSGAQMPLDLRHED